MTRARRSSTVRILLAVLAALSLIAAACSDDGSASDGDGTSSADGSGSGDDGSMAPPERRVVSLPGAQTDAPDEYDTVTVVQHGSPDATNVLVLSPGTSAGAGYFEPLADALTEQVPGWQVWAVDRRENLLEDHSVVTAYRNGEATAQEGFEYYLEWLTDPSVEEHFEPPADDEVAWARDWGMDVAVEDLRVVIEEAAALGGDVVLGGHSLGGSITVAYATWDVDGRPGADDLDGIVLIDGGSSSSSTTDPADVEQALAELDEGSPFLDLVGLGLPWAAGVLNVLGSAVALEEPDAANLTYQWPVFPAELKPPAPPSNAGQYGYALDVDTSPESLQLVHLTMGELADSGEPRGFVDNERVPVERAATLFASTEGIDGTSWYHPSRLSIDASTLNGGIANPAQEVAGVEAVHGEDLALAIFALETGFGMGRVLAGAEALAEASGIDSDEVTLVEAHELTHTDPMAVVPELNPLVEELVPWLQQLG